MHQTFYGKLESTITCKSCGDINTSVESFLDLSLGLEAWSKKKNLKASALSLQKCLDEEYKKPEDCNYNCHQCDSHDAIKQLSIKSLPNVLCIQLKVSRSYTIRPETRWLTDNHLALQTKQRSSVQDRHESLVSPETRNATLHLPSTESRYTRELLLGAIMHLRTPKRRCARWESRNRYA